MIHHFPAETVDSLDPGRQSPTGAAKSRELETHTQSEQKCTWRQQCLTSLFSGDEQSKEHNLAVNASNYNTDHHLECGGGAISHRIMIPPSSSYYLMTERKMWIIKNMVVIVLSTSRMSLAQRTNSVHLRGAHLCRRANVVLARSWFFEKNVVLNVKINSFQLNAQSEFFFLKDICHLFAVLCQALFRFFLVNRSLKFDVQHFHNSEKKNFFLIG